MISSAGVQFLNFFGSNVIAVSNTKNMELIKSIGADSVIDYQREDFTKTDKMFDYIFDAVGKSYFVECDNLFNKKGIYI